jgi:hypothetical protein
MAVLVIAEFSCKIADIFNHLAKHKYLTADIMLSAMRVRRKPLTCEGILIAIADV